MNYLMLSCKKASALIDRKSLVGLTTKERMRLKMHVSMCDACTTYQKQSLLLDKFLYNHINSGDGNNILLFDDKGLKEKINSKL